MMTMMANEGNEGKDGIEDRDFLDTCHAPEVKINKTIWKFMPSL